MHAYKTLVVLLMLLLMVKAAPTPQITCSAEPSTIGNNASVVCHFPKDVSEGKVDFYVTHHNHIDKNVLVCSWPDGTVNCISRDGFSLHDNQAGTNTTMDIQDFQTDKQGLYKCHVIGVAEEVVEGCELKTKDSEQTTESSGSEDRVLLYILVPIGVACVLVAIITAVCLYKKKKRQSQMKAEDGPHAMPLLQQNRKDTQHSYTQDRKDADGDGQNPPSQQGKGDNHSTHNSENASNWKGTEPTQSEEHPDDLDDPKQVEQFELNKRLGSMNKTFPDLKSDKNRKAETDDDTKPEVRHQVSSGSQKSNGRKINSSDYRMPSVAPREKRFQQMNDTEFVERDRRRKAEASKTKTNQESGAKDKGVSAKKQD